MIIKLHPNIINKIAAGEVVERPASVLKELVENAIDAKANKITINLENQGLRLIRIQDNGIGMDREDSILACKSHSTSKITTIDDLSNISTMGFRGEALASISSVSKLTLISKSAKETSGTEIIIDGGKKQSIKDATIRQGTSISVEKLFKNIPARLKFLKSPATEYKHLISTFLNYALSFPNIHFVLNHNKRTIYNLPSVASENKNEELKVRINDLFGNDIAQNLVSINYDSPYLKINGFIGHPRIARSQKSHQLLFINNRPIQDKLIAKAVYDSYSTLIPKGKYPTFFLFFETDPSKFDVNVHPRKSQVRFENPQQIFQAVLNGTKQTLLRFLKQDSKKALEEFSQFQKPTPRVLSRRTLPKSESQQKTRYPSSRAQISKSIQFTKSLLQQDHHRIGFRIQKAPRAFQVFNTYIIIEKEDKLLIIDQHAAAERATYDKLIEQSGKDSVETQRLLIPEVIELNKGEFEMLNEYRDNLKKFGIRLSIFGESTIKIEEIPALLAKADISELIKDIVSELEEELGQKKPKSIEIIKEQILATMACHSSIRSGMKLHQEEINDLVVKLLNCKSPYSCPHGRPIMWEISKSELEKKVGRH